MVHRSARIPSKESNYEQGIQTIYYKGVRSLLRNKDYEERLSDCKIGGGSMWNDKNSVYPAEKRGKYIYQTVAELLTS
jgi:hypothetical protein